MSESTEEQVNPQNTANAVEEVISPAKVEQPLRPKKVEYVTASFLYKVVVLVTIMTSFLTVFTYHRMFATHIVTFDLQEYLTKIRTDTANGKLTPDQLKARLDILENSVNGVPKNTIVITGDVILGKNANKLIVPEQ